MTTDEHWITFSVALRINAPSIDLNGLEQVLDLRHTTFLTKGCKLRKLTYRGEQDKWVCNIAKGEVSNWDFIVDQVRSILQPKVHILAEIPRLFNCHVELYISCHSDLASSSFELPVSLLVLLAHAKLPLRISILSWGQVDDCHPVPIDDA